VTYDPIVHALFPFLPYTFVDLEALPVPSSTKTSRSQALRTMPTSSKGKATLNGVHLTPAATLSPQLLADNAKALVLPFHSQLSPAPTPSRPSSVTNAPSPRRVSSEKRPRPDSLQSHVENERPLGFKRRCNAP